MTPRPTTLTIFVPVVIQASDTKELQQVVRELKHTHVQYTSDGNEGRGMFRIIASGVKLRDVKERFNKLQVRPRGVLNQEDESWPFRDQKGGSQRASSSSKRSPARSAKRVR